MTTCVLIMLAAPFAVGQPVSIDWYTIDGGGVMRSTGADIELSGTVGQHDAGTMSSGAITVNGGFWALEFGVLPAPVIIHGQPGVSWIDHAFSGYVDPRCDAGNPPFCDPTKQIAGVNIVFNVEPFGDALGGPVTPASFVVTETGGGTPPNVSSVAKTGNSVLVELDRVITLQQWTTVEANVFNLDGAPIQDLGNQGPGVDEPDRIDVSRLPGDIDQGGRALPLDNTRFRQMYSGTYHNNRGVDEDYGDITRDGRILPFDITVWRINYEAWLYVTLPPQP